MYNPASKKAEEFINHEEILVDIKLRRRKQSTTKC